MRFCFMFDLVGLCFVVLVVGLGPVTQLDTSQHPGHET